MDKKLQRGIVSVLTANIINLLFSLVTNFVLPKYLSVESYAGIKTFQLYVSYAGLFHFGYIDGIYLKYGGRSLDRHIDKDFGTDLSTICTFQFVITFVTLAVGIVLGDYVLALFAFSILPQNMANFYKLIYQATGEFGLYGRVMNFTTVATFTLNMILLFVFRLDGFKWYISCYVILYFIIWSMLFAHFQRNHIVEKGKMFSFSVLIENIQSGILLTLGNLSSIFLTSMDRWFVKFLLGITSFAQYSFAVSIENFLTLASTPVTTTLYNFFCRENSRETHKKVYRYIVIFATIVPAAAFPVKFIIELYLPKYIEAVGIIFILFAAQIYYMVIKSIFVNLYKVNKEQKIYFARLISIIIVGFIFNCLTFSVYRAKESFAIGTLLSSIVWYVLSGRDYKYLFDAVNVQAYLLFESVLFILLGLKTTAVLGLVGYILGTIILLNTFMRDDLIEILAITKTKISKKI